MEVIADQDFNLAYDIIFMDVQMPVIGGLETGRAIRAREARRLKGLRPPAQAGLACPD